MQQEIHDLRSRDILEKIQQLNPKQVAEVVDFIDFLVQKKSTPLPLLQLMNETSGPELDLYELRRRLASISGTMADTVQELRNERI